MSEQPWTKCPRLHVSWALSPPDMNGPEEGEPLPECWNCESEYQYERKAMDDGMCLDCHEKNGEVFCEICNQWGIGRKAEGPLESDACYGCLNEAYAEANRINDERRRMEEL